MIRVSGLVKAFVDRAVQVKAADDVTFEVPEGKFFTLLGPSGCGKTTTLRCLAGLERPDGGEIEVAGQVVYSSASRTFVPPNRRPIGMVFQSYAIWPHMSVFDNVAYPLRVGKTKYDKQEVRERVERALELVQLSGLGSRMAPQLSGGQQQRLALARALVHEPKVLLLDEPLSNLDAKLRERTRAELRDLQRRLQITTVFVTHDQGEALAMSDYIAVMHEGKILQQGTPRQIYREPRSRFVAEFIGSTNVLSGTLEQARAESSWDAMVRTPIGDLCCARPIGMATAEDVMVLIRPEDVTLHRDPPEAANVFAGRVESAVFLGDYLDCRLAVGDTPLRARPRSSWDLTAGDAVWVEFPPSACSILSATDVSARVGVDE